MIDPDQPISQKHFAAVFGISQSLVSALVKDGTLRKEGTFAQWRDAYISREIELNSGSGNTEWQSERVQLMRLRRMQAQLDYDRSAAKLVPLKDVEFFVSDLTITARTSFLQLPNWVIAKAGHLLRDGDAALQMHALLDDEVRSILETMAKRGDQLRPELTPESEQSEGDRTLIEPQEPAADGDRRRLKLAA